MGFISWLKGVIAKLISKKDIESALNINTAVSEAMNSAISLWTAMYHNEPPWKSKTVQTLNLPAVIASKVAKMVTVEAKVKIDGSSRALWLNDQFSPVWDNIRILAERAIAKGGLIFKPYISDGRIIIDCVQADRFFPTGFDGNGNVIGGVFVAQKTQGRTIFTRLERHEFQGDTYTVTQQAFRSTTPGFLGRLCNLAEVPEWASIAHYTKILNLTAPLFVYWKMPFANCIDDISPLGVSIYAKAAETIEQIDRQYSRLLWEYESGERAIHASADLFRKDEKDLPVLPEGRKRQYRLVEDYLVEGNSNRNLFEVFSPDFRDSSLLNGFNALLRQMEQQCGLAAGTFSDPATIARTATEISSTKEESYTTVSDIQKSLEAALSKLLEAMDALTSAGNLAPKGSWEVAFDWDDSIVNSPSERKKLFWQYVQSGKFPFWKYLVEFEGYSEKDAKEIQAEASQGTGDPYA